MTSQTNRSNRQAPAPVQAAALVLSLAALLFPPLVRAQSSAPTGPSSTTASTDESSTAATPVKKPEEPTVKLDPFEVRTEKDTSYGALNSNSITRFNIELAKTPVVADIFTSQFMQDTQVQTVEDLFNNYGTAAGMSFATPGDSNATQLGDRFFGQQYAIRGLPAGTAHRDGFDFNPTSTITTSIFDIDRVEIIHGSQGLLYGAVGAGGVVNIISKQARFNQQDAIVSERMDQYGSKTTNLDANEGNKWVAARVAGVYQDDQSRRLYIGDKTEGYYGQLAFRVPFKSIESTLRLTAEESRNKVMLANNTKLSSGDPTRSGDALTYLYATHQLGAISPITGRPYANPGALDNGYVTNENMQSFGGWRSEEDVDNDIYEATLDTVWTPWLSTSFGAMYDKSQELRGTNVGNLLAPGSGGNPFPSDWAVSSSMAESENPSRKKSARAAALFTNDIGSWGHSQTAIGFDREYNDISGNFQYQYYAANSNGIVALDPSKSNLGRTQIPTLYWTVDKGPIEYPYQKVGAKTIVVNGQLYVRMSTNPRNAAWITPNNPLGLASIYQAENFPKVSAASGNNSGDWAQQSRTQGWYVANYTSWWGDRFATLFGIRETDTFSRNANTSATTLEPFLEKRAGNLPSYNAGVDFRLLKWMNLRGYYGYSRSFNVVGGSLDPLGVAPPNPTGWTHEGGIKFQSNDGRISGDLAAWLGYEQNDNYNAGTDFRDTINPSGLNGPILGPDGVKNQWAAVDHTARGVELSMTAAPTDNWRARFSVAVQDGTVLKDKTYALHYNDQFRTDGKGNVIYANGNPVLVPDPSNPANAAVLTALAKQTSTVDPSAAAPYAAAPKVPLTLSMINDPTSPYFAFATGSAGVNPAVSPSSEPLNGSIGNGTTGTGDNILKNVLGQFTNGGTTSLTGAVGLPISAIQYNWADPGNYQGTYIVAKKGNYTVGYPVYTANMETAYTFSQWWIKGVGIGGSMNLAWYYRSYYYHTPDRNQHLFSQPLLNPTINAFLSYTHKFRWVTWHTQLNINNLFNHYVVALYPNDGTGFTVPGNIGATYYGQPRDYIWSNSLTF